MKKKAGVSILAAILLFCVCLPVRADLITIGLTGKIIRADDPQNVFGGQIHINDTITATYKYNTSTPDSNPSDMSIGDYWYYTAPYGISVYIGNLVFKTNSDDVQFLVEIGNNCPVDDYLIRSRSNICSNGALVEDISWQLEDYRSTALSSDALPTTAPNLADWNNMVYGLTITGPGQGNFLIRADITSAILIPEPATLFLFGFGIFLTKRKRGK